MKVTLLHNTPLWVCSQAIRKCWASEDKSDSTEYHVDVANDDVEDFHLEGTKITGPKDKALIDRVGNKNRHSSTLEHLVYNFDIDGISRACLQELARTRIASLSVKSTRYTLKEIKKIDNVLIEEIQEDGITKGISTAKCDVTGKRYKIDKENLEKFLVVVKSPAVNIASAKALENLRLILKSGLSNDIAKYCLPESFKTSLGWTINARSLQNFLTLRTSPNALHEIRDLANNIYDQLPDDHKYLFEDCIYK